MAHEGHDAGGKSIDAKTMGSKGGGSKKSNVDTALKKLPATVMEARRLGSGQDPPEHDAAQRIFCRVRAHGEGREAIGSRRDQGHTRHGAKLPTGTFPPLINNTQRQELGVPAQLLRV